MKTAKLIIGIVSIVLWAIVSFQSCVVGLGNIIFETEETSGFAGIFLAFCMLVAGIIAICTRYSPSGGKVAGVFYLIGGLMGITNIGTFSDLGVWSVLCLIFAAVFLFGKDQTSS